MFKNRVFLIIGDDFLSRKHALESLKKKLIKGKPSFFKSTTVYSDRIDLDGIQELLFSFSFDGERVVVFKDALNLDEDIKVFIHRNLKTIVKNNYLVMEIDRSSEDVRRDKRLGKDKFFAYLFKYAQIIRIRSSVPQVSINKLIFAVRGGRLADSLYILENLFSGARMHTDALAMMILGALSREFSMLSLPLEKERCFKLIWKAERELKEGRVPPKLSVELLITKLMLAGPS